MTGRRLRPFFSYFGSKWGHAPKYPLARYRTIIEPFAGAAGYSLLYPDHNVILCDVNPTVTRLWRYLISANPQRILDLPQQKSDRLSEAERDLIGFWYGDARVSPRNKPGSWGRWGPRIRARIAAQVPRIRHWRVVDGDYRKLPDVEATWFIDPPYQQYGHYYIKGSNQLDYAALAKWCRSRLGQVIVCEAEGATWLPFQHFRASIRATVKTKRENPTNEVVWYQNTPR